MQTFAACFARRSGCSDVETVTDNLYIALLLATPHTQSTETSFCFGIVKVGVEMDCNMEQMFTSLRGDQVRQVRTGKG
jgi:hypothetical protein